MAQSSPILLIGLLWMKLCVFVLIQVFPVIVKIGDWALRWTEGNTGSSAYLVDAFVPFDYETHSVLYRGYVHQEEDLLQTLTRNRMTMRVQNELGNDNRDSHGCSFGGLGVRVMMATELGRGSYCEGCEAFVPHWIQC